MAAAIRSTCTGPPASDTVTCGDLPVRLHLPAPARPAAWTSNECLDQQRRLARPRASRASNTPGPASLCGACPSGFSGRPRHNLHKDIDECLTNIRRLRSARNVHEHAEARAPAAPARPATPGTGADRLRQHRLLPHQQWRLQAGRDLHQRAGVAHLPVRAHRVHRRRLQRCTDINEVPARYPPLRIHSPPAPPPPARSPCGTFVGLQRHRCDGLHAHQSVPHQQRRLRSAHGLHEARRARNSMWRLPGGLRRHRCDGLHRHQRVREEQRRLRSAHHLHQHARLIRVCREHALRLQRERGRRFARTSTSA